MKVLIREPLNQPLQLKEIEGSLKDLQKIVGGYIEVIQITQDILCILDEEGRLKGSDNNFWHDQYGWIVGTVIFVASEGEEFASLSDNQIDYIEEYIGFPVI